MNPFIVNRLCSIACSPLLGSVSRDVASVCIDGRGALEEESPDYSGIVRLMALMDGPKEGPNKNMKKIELSEDDSDFIASLTGNRGQGSLVVSQHDLGGGDDLVGDEEEGMARLGFVEKLGLNVVERLQNSKFRNRSDLLTLTPMDMWGNHDVRVMEQFRKWCKEEFGTFGEYTNALLGKRASESFLKRLKELQADPDEMTKSVEQFMGKEIEKIEKDRQVPGKAWAQAHHILRSDLGTMDPEEHKLRWNAVDQAQGYTLEDGRLEDEIEHRSARNGWIFDAEGKPKYIGFPIPYVYVDQKPKEIQTARGPLKVLNVNCTVGDKPSLQFHNLVVLAHDPKSTDKQRFIRQEILRRYQSSMADRDASIKTGKNGHFFVYYKVYRVEGKLCTVFSPIPMRDLRDDRVKQIKDKLALKRQRESIRETDDYISDA